MKLIGRGGAFHESTDSKTSKLLAMRGFAWGIKQSPGVGFFHGFPVQRHYQYIHGICSL